ncbi:alanine--tRNA ligase [bacterium]|nr:alanine--tRNA ligase [bacterium]
MDSNEIRKIFLDYFENKGHTIVQSASLIPHEDPSLLFTNAGMNQFKDLFLGNTQLPYRRAASVQKCVRVSGKHNDLEEVGKDGSHHTFFEMLGNWSFGDYFKEGAIEFAWELLTSGYKLPEERLWITVFNDDDESEAIWHKKIGLPMSRILRFGEKDNFWEMGATGPCGPCTEIHYDRGAEFGCDKIDCRPNCSCGRFVEIWNLVFIQFNRDRDGILRDLPRKNVDTGLGFERLVTIIQGKNTNYETDLFQPIIKQIEEITGRSFYNPEYKMAFRVLADHVRALTFAIADGVLPSSDGRGYVLRRILRRAARYSRKLGYKDPILYRLTSPLIDLMGNTYPELLSRAEHISMVIHSEEERFGETLDSGLELFEGIISKANRDGSQIIWGEDAFKLYDTYGFPIDLTNLMAEESGLVVDMKGFEKLLEEQRERSRSASRFEVKSSNNQSKQYVHLSSGSHSRFDGYQKLEVKSRLRRYFQKDNRYYLVLENTPFYAESGGQVGDSGEIYNDHFRFQVEDTQRYEDEILHIGKLKEGELNEEDVTAVVDVSRRLAIARNHTCTHLLQYALRKVLGEHVQQSGSAVSEERLRFDYTHFQQPDKEELWEVERLVNEAIMADYEVIKSKECYDTAVKSGALAFFGDKYGEEVRVISIDPISRELCGGTHLDRTGQIGCFVMYSESSVASGVRRIEAYTGFNALKYVNRYRKEMGNLVSLLKCKPEDVSDRIKNLLEENKRLLREKDDLVLEMASAGVDEAIIGSAEIDGSRLVVCDVPVDSRDKLLSFADAIKSKLKSGVAVLGARLEDNNAALVIIVTPDIIEKKGINANQLIKKIAERINGSGGGRAAFAQAGGSEGQNLSDALDYAKKHLAHEMAK